MRQIFEYSPTFFNTLVDKRTDTSYRFNMIVIPKSMERTYHVGNKYINKYTHSDCRCQ